MESSVTRGEKSFTNSRPTASHDIPHAWIATFTAVIALALLVTTSPIASASNVDPTCINSIQALGPLNDSTNTTMSLCAGAQSDFTTSQWKTGWTDLYINNQPCNGNSNSYSYSYDYSGGLYGKESVRADSTSGCTTNVAEVQTSVGLHGQSFSAWKAGSAYYTVVANYTFYDYEATATYCQYTGTESAKANISALVAMYDDNLGTGVGASTNGYYHSTVIWQSCNIAASSKDVAVHVQASFTTSTAIANGNTLVPRASVIADVWVSSPSTLSAAHAASSLDYDNDGYGYITLNSIWVY